MIITYSIKIPLLGKTAKIFNSKLIFNYEKITTNKIIGAMACRLAGGKHKFVGADSIAQYKRSYPKL